METGASDGLAVAVLREELEGPGRMLAARIDAQGCELRREFREQLEAQGRHLGTRIDALTARFDAHLERHAS